MRRRNQRLQKYDHSVLPKCEEAFCRGNLAEFFPNHRFGSENCDFVWTYEHGVKSRNQVEEEDTL
jgi:hypothetical protein